MKCMLFRRHWVKVLATRRDFRMYGIQTTAPIKAAINWPPSFGSMLSNSTNAGSERNRQCSPQQCDDRHTNRPYELKNKEPREIARPPKKQHGRVHKEPN